MVLWHHLLGDEPPPLHRPPQNINGGVVVLRHWIHPMSSSIITMTTRMKIQYLYHAVTGKYEKKQWIESHDIIGWIEWIYIGNSLTFGPTWAYRPTTRHQRFPTKAYWCIMNDTIYGPPLSKMVDVTLFRYYWITPPLCPVDGRMPSRLVSKCSNWFIGTTLSWVRIDHHGI